MPKRELPKAKLPSDLTTPIQLDIIDEKVSLITSGSVEQFEIDRQILEDAQAKYIKSEIDRKFKILADFFDVQLDKEGAWQKLAVSMAFTLLDGFKGVPKVKKGAREKWDDLVLFRLVYEVREKMVSSNLSALQVCHFLAEVEPWKSLLKTSDRSKAKMSLYQQFNKALKSPVVIFIDRISTLESSQTVIPAAATDFYKLIVSEKIKNRSFMNFLKK